MIWKVIGAALDLICAPWNGHLLCRMKWYRRFMAWCYMREDGEEQ